MSTTTREFGFVKRSTLYESPLNPRKHFDGAGLEELAASIRTSGVLEALVVRPNPNGKGQYEIAAGHRRFRAAALAGVDELPVRIVEMDDAAFVEAITVSNLQRTDIHPLEEAEGFKTLMERAGYDVAKIAARIGRSTRYVYDALTLLKLTPEAKELFLAGRFERGHAIELARLNTDDQARALESARSGNGQVGGLFVPEHVDDDQEDLELDEGPRKPVSVREFRQWVTDRVRFRPAEADPVLFPETVQALTAATEERERVIEITYDHRPPDEVRDPDAPRIYGAQAWRSATPGIPSPDDRWATKPKAAKPCEHAITGVVVVGERRGEAFKVCIKKEKCAVHWADWQKERERRVKANAAGGTDADGSWKDSYQAKLERQWAKEEAERGRYAKAAPRIRKAILAAVEASPITPTSPAVALVVRRVVGYGGKVPKAATLEALLRALALDLAQAELRSEWGADRQWPPLCKAFGVDLKAILNEAAPIEKPAPKGRPVKKAARAKKGGVA